MTEPLVSILINNYTYSKFLRQAIESALCQTYARLEIVVVDDGSTDQSREIISSYGAKVIPVFKENGGQASAFNAGVEASHGDILCFLDSDDYFDLGKTVRIVELFNGLDNSKPFMVHHTMSIQHEDGKTQKPEFFGRTHENPLNLADYARKYKYMHYVAGVTSSISINRRMAELLFPLPANIRVSADDFIVRGGSLVGELYSSSDVLGVYRVHGNNLWFSGKRQKSAEFLESLDRYLNQKMKENQLPGRISYSESMLCWWDLLCDERWSELLWRMIKINIVQHDRHTLIFTFGICRSAARRLLEKKLPFASARFTRKQP